MKIPKYIQEMLERRCEWAIYSTHLSKDDDPSCTILIHKRSHYCTTDTLMKEVKKFIKWVNSQNKLNIIWGTIKYVPMHTHHCDQWAKVEVVDPVLQQIEKFIPEKYRYGTRSSC